ncbi:MAG: tRNA (adenosine(37)-N6)-threonylcarbamoyltransferase complex transferase subunit TsaD [bacterium]|nr:tRNA (adenosine(37)-N6)-threonylcarbamoyltransferase complex transferase subunit TsaD [bacterium]
MKILAIETSCDETAVALLDCNGDLKNASFSVLGNALYSQASLHAEYGGVYPSLAKREHQGNLAPLTLDVLKQAGFLKIGAFDVKESALGDIRDKAFKDDVQKFLEETAKPPIDAIAVTQGPGLEPALWTGINFAQALGNAWKIPVLGIDHMEGHIVSAMLKSVPSDQGTVNSGEPKRYALSTVHFPLLALLISGGHTELVLMKEWFSYEHVGRTKDDAVGEAFDKVARLLELPYPGGPKIQESAARSRARGGTDITFPRPLMHAETCDFSFSGLKTAVLYKMRSMEQISEEDKEEIAEAFEEAAKESIVSKTNRAVKETKPESLVVGGGVSANVEIRKALQEMISDYPGMKLLLPEAGLTGDNAIMIGAAAYLRNIAGKTGSKKIKAEGSRKLA